MNNARKFKAVQENVEGDFYVEDGCCTLCGIPPAEAPSLFGGWDENGNITHGQCFVKKQPTTEFELQQMINAMATQEIGCIRYCGVDELIKANLMKRGEGERIDW